MFLVYLPPPTPPPPTHHRRVSAATHKNTPIVLIMLFLQMKPDNHGKAGPIYLVQNVYLLIIL